MRRLFLGVMAIMMVMVSHLVPASAQTLRLDITDGQVAPIPIAIAEFTGLDGVPTTVGSQISQIISDDLASSGQFKPVDSAAFIAPPESPAIRPNFNDWAPLGVQGLLIGSAYIDDQGLLQIEFVLWDVIAQRDITSGESSTDTAGLRRLSHQIADFVYEEFTGDSAYFDTQIVYVSDQALLTGA